MLKGLALDYHERYASIPELRKALLQETDEKEPQTDNKKNSGTFKIVIPLLLLTVTLSAWGIELSTERSGQKTDYAGNFDRGSVEAQEFLELIRKNAVSSETAEDGKSMIYHLPEKVIRSYGKPCNRYRLLKTKKELDAYLTQNDFSYTKTEKETECTATVSEYDLIQTDFYKKTEYQLEDFCMLTVEEDLNNGDILDFYMTCQRKAGVEPGEMASKLLLFLTDASDPEGKTVKDLTARDQELLEQGKTEGTVYMYQWEEGLLIFDESGKESLTVRILPRKSVGL